MRIALLALTASLTFAGGANAADKCKEISPAADLETPIKAYYAALVAADRDAQAKLTIPSFHAFDVARRFTGQALGDMVAGAPARGLKLEFSFDDFQTHTACDTGWASWINHGAIVHGEDRTPVTWLESATLRRIDGRWVLVFLHSERAPDPKPAAK
jgi:hypothetical protein